MTLGERLKKIEELEQDINEDIKQRAPWEIWHLFPQIVSSGSQLALGVTTDVDFGTREEIIKALRWLADDLENDGTSDR